MRSIMARRARGLRKQRWRETGWFCVAEQIQAIGNCSLLIRRSLGLPTFPALERLCWRAVARRRSRGLIDNFTAVLVFTDFPWRRVTQLVVLLPSFVYLSNPTFNHCSFNLCTRWSFLPRPPLHFVSQPITCILYVFTYAFYESILEGGQNLYLESEVLLYWTWVKLEGWHQDLVLCSSSKKEIFVQIQ